MAQAVGAFSFGFALLTIVVAIKSFRRRSSIAAQQNFLPLVTILKPLKGEEQELYENLRSFCALDYPDFQLLFAVESPEDPALRVIERLKKEFPGLDMATVISRSRIGFNPKINNLAKTVPFIKHELLLMSDSDIRVEPDFLKHAVWPLRNPSVGLVTCFYQSATPPGVWNRLEALCVNAHFLPQALTAASFGMRFAMGAAIIVRRKALEKSGGLANLASHLADDFILGESIKALGFSLEYAGNSVESIPDVSSGREHLSHQIRWARTIRLCQPIGFLGTFLLHGFSLLTLKTILFGLDWVSLALAGAILATKALAQGLLQHSFHGNRRRSLSLSLLPLSEWISFAAWLGALQSKEVLWRGKLYPIEPELVSGSIQTMEVCPQALPESQA
jgi:ceramide glucosyltransferase